MLESVLEEAGDSERRELAGDLVEVGAQGGTRSLELASRGGELLLQVLLASPVGRLDEEEDPAPGGDELLDLRELALELAKCSSELRLGREAVLRSPVAESGEDEISHGIEPSIWPSA